MVHVVGLLGPCAGEVTASLGAGKPFGPLRAFHSEGGHTLFVLLEHSGKELWDHLLSQQEGGGKSDECMRAAAILFCVSHTVVITQRGSCFDVDWLRALRAIWKQKQALQAQSANLPLPPPTLLWALATSCTSPSVHITVARQVQTVLLAALPQQQTLFSISKGPSHFTEIQHAGNAVLLLPRSPARTFAAQPTVTAELVQNRAAELAAFLSSNEDIKGSPHMCPSTTAYDLLSTFLAPHAQHKRGCLMSHAEIRQLCESLQAPPPVSDVVGMAALVSVVVGMAAPHHSWDAPRLVGGGSCGPHTTVL